MREEKKEKSDALPQPTRSNYMNRRRNRSFVAEVQGERRSREEQKTSVLRGTSVKVKNQVW